MHFRVNLDAAGRKAYEWQAGSGVRIRVLDIGGRVKWKAVLVVLQYPKCEVYGVR